MVIFIENMIKFFLYYFCISNIIVYLHIQLNDLLIRGCARHGQVQEAMRSIEVKVYTREDLLKNIKWCEDKLLLLQPGRDDYNINIKKRAIAKYELLLASTDDYEIYVFKGEVVNNKLPEWLKI